jgi:hypothetical protein
MTPVRCVMIAAGLGLLAGCSTRSVERAAPEHGLLQEVNDLLHASAGALGRPPAKLDDLSKHRSIYPRGYEAVQSGAVVVLWRTALKGEGEAGKDEAVLAYEKATPTDGGYVLLSAGTVKKMTAAEFDTAPKAGKK